MKETDLYQPVKDYLEKQGFEVKAEVGDCDVVAVKGDLLVVVELKLTLNMKLLFQAVERKSLSEDIYIAVPNQGTFLKKHYSQLIKLLKLLGIGLLLIDDSRVDPVLDPSEYKPVRRKNKSAKLLKDYAELVGDPNIGGSSKVSGRMTPYRQKALAIANYLIQNGPEKASKVKDELENPKARDILYRNVYGWFEMQGKGIYKITPRGEEEYAHWTKDQ
ncbi:MAG: hypothetical protein HRT89_20835 [Lentisphaeria bacterium]|nr:hypothetical protein [Lentisphaeria bacterium]